MRSSASLDEPRATALIDRALSGDATVLTELFSLVEPHVDRAVRGPMRATMLGRSRNFEDHVANVCLLYTSDAADE